MSVEMTIDGERTVIYARPDHGRPIAFLVEPRFVKISWSRYDQRRETRYVVGLKGNHDTVFSRHVTEEAAQRACLRRATKYDRAYSVPRGLAAA